HIVASAKGSCIGRLRIRDRNDIIDLEGLGSGGWTISPMLDNIEIIESDAEFILVLEKDAAMIRLSEARFWQKYPCIILTAKGAADMATRMFLKRLSKDLNLPIFSFVYSDPYGHYIHSVYLRGSKRLSYESPFLATPNIKLLGVLTRDLDKYKIPNDCRLVMTNQDIKRVKEMLEEDFVKKNKAWETDLKLALKMKIKAEIQALSAHGFEFLTEQYLPEKLSTGDWI
ncbi:MAG: DNA topoisomerase VI, partial [archaeon]|nr:DNA topoisomerase VI [archaeon]